MLKVGRTVQFVAATMGLAGGLVLFDANAPAALAYDSGPPKVSYPSSILTEVNNSAGNAYNGGDWNKTLTKNPKALPTGGFATKVGGEVAGGTAALALMLGLDIGTNIAGVVGLPTSGSFICDLSTALGTGYGCTPVPGPDYPPNSDLGVVRPGMVNDGRIVYGRDMLGPGLHYATMELANIRNETVTGLEFDLVPLAVNGSQSVTTLVGRCLDVATGTVTNSVALNTFNPYGGGTVTYPAGATQATSWRVDCAVGRVLQWVSVSSWSGNEEWQGAYLTEANPAREPTPEQDPLRWWRVTWECSTGGPGVRQSSPFRETDPEWPGFPTTQCDAGTLTRVLIEQLTENGPTTTLLDWAIPDTVRDWMNTNPQCAGGGCVLELERLDPETGRWLDCHAAASLCLDWQAQPQKEDTFRCAYGGEVVSLDECRVYPFAAEAPERIGSPNPDVPPEPAPAPSPDAQPEPQPSPDCPPPFTWTSMFNPWWYFKVGTCVAEWAVIPPPGSVDTHMADLREGLNEKAPFSVIAVVPEATANIGEGWGSSCEALPDFSAIEGKPLRLPCQPPESAGFTLAYGLMSVLIWTSVVFGVWRMVHQAVGGRD